MIQHNYSSYFRVFKNDTVVTEVFTNNFKPLKLKYVKGNWLVGNTHEVFCAVCDLRYSLPADDPMFYGYATRVKAMQMAKAGALSYINSLINEGEPGAELLLQYRRDHYDDLHFNLVDANIRNIEDGLAGQIITG